MVFRSGVWRPLIWMAALFLQGGVGYDINCGCRLIATNLSLGDIKNRLSDLTTALYQRIPSGVGSTGSVKLSGKDQKKVLEEGAEGR